LNFNHILTSSCNVRSHKLEALSVVHSTCSKDRPEDGPTNWAKTRSWNYSLMWFGKIQSCVWLHYIYILYCTGRFIMFSAITSIYNKKTKWPPLMELFTATGKLKKFFFLQLEMFDVCATGDTAHIDTIFKFLPHASTWVHRYSSLLQWSVPIIQRGHVAMVGRTSTIFWKKRLLTWYILLVWRTFSAVLMYGIYKWNIVRNYFNSVLQYYFLEDISKDSTKSDSWNVQCKCNIQTYFYWLNCESLHFTHLSVTHFWNRRPRNRWPVRTHIITNLSFVYLTGAWWWLLLKPKHTAQAWSTVKYSWNYCCSRWLITSRDYVEALLCHTALSTD
jgi:hypothetical protein